MSRRWFWWGLLASLLVFPVAFNGCLVWQLATAHCVQGLPADNMQGFDPPFTFPLNGHGALSVYVLHDPTNGPPILLLHELPGMTPECVRFARNLAARHFTVYLPLLFGEAGKALEGFAAFSACRKPEFECIANRPSRMADLLRPLITEIAKRESHANTGTELLPIGVIGMCLTGNFSLVLLQEPNVMAAVLSQPALPFPIFPGRGRLLGLSDPQVRAVRSSHTPILVFRFTTDHLSPQTRLAALKTAFPRQIELVPVFALHMSHGVFTGYFDTNKPETTAAFEKLVSFFNAHLRTYMPGMSRAAGALQ